MALGHSSAHDLSTSEQVDSGNIEACIQAWGICHAAVLSMSGLTDLLGVRLQTSVDVHDRTHCTSYVKAKMVGRYIWHMWACEGRCMLSWAAYE